MSLPISLATKPNEWCSPSISIPFQPNPVSNKWLSFDVSFNGFRVDFPFNQTQFTISGSPVDVLFDQTPCQMSGFPFDVPFNQTPFQWFSCRLTLQPNPISIEWFSFPFPFNQRQTNKTSGVSFDVSCNQTPFNLCGLLWRSLSTKPHFKPAEWILTQKASKISKSHAGPWRKASGRSRKPWMPWRS